MGFTPAFKTIPRDVVEWAKYLRAVENAAGSVSNEQLRDSEAVSVIGRSANSVGAPADIEASANDQFLVRRANVLGFGGLVDADIPATLARDTEVTAAITALNLGTASTQNTGTSGATVPLLNGTNVHTSGQFTAFGVGTTATQQAANADTSGATLGQLETEVNELKAVLRAFGLIAT